MTSWYNALTRAGIPKLWISDFGIDAHILEKYQKDVPSGRTDNGCRACRLYVRQFGLVYPELAGKYRYIAAILLLAAFLMHRFRAGATGGSPIPRKAIYKWGVNASMLLAIPLLLFSLSSLTDHLSLYLFLLPFVVVLMPSANLSVKEFLTSLF